jgi:hypothetical protein
VWQNYRWVVHGKASSQGGLKEVALYDGTRLFRRFLPRGKTEFEFSLNLTHDRRHCLVMIATDRQGGRAISGDQWDRNHRAEEFMCGDRNHQLTCGYVINKDGIGLLLGAPAFDGAAGGEPEVWENTSPLSPAHPVPTPVVTEARRLLISRDVMIGDGPREYSFAEGIPVHNVWHTLWRTQPVKEFSVNRRNHFFQINPDSPLAVFLWQIDITLKEDLPNQGFQLAVLQARASRTWALRSDASTLRAGEWEKSADSAEPVSTRFGLNTYAAFLDSPLGGAALFPLTDGLALDGGKAAYTLSLDQGSVLSQRYILAIDAKNTGGMSGRLEGNAWATISLSSSAGLFIGHPVLVDNPELFVQVTQCDEGAWTIEVHNPTDAPITTRLRPNPAFDPLAPKAFPADGVTVPPGTSVIQKR